MNIYSELYLTVSNIKHRVVMSQKQITNQKHGALIHRQGVFNEAKAALEWPVLQKVLV